MKSITWVVFGCLSMLVSVCSYANDSIARVGVGGLELLKTDNIQMVSEVLEISPLKIRVTYHFLNTSNNAITTNVAFPMPPYGFNPEFVEGAANKRPLDSFKMWVEGQEAPIKMDRVALINGKDATENLRKIGLSENQIFKTFGDCHANHSNGFIECGLSSAQNSEISKLCNDKCNSWTVTETAYWEQTFPAGKEIEVIHEYQPFVGARYSYSNEGIPGNPQEVCLDEGTKRAIVKRSEGKGVVSINEVEYILGTGRNWSGPIKKFKLIIHKDSDDKDVSLDDEIVSLCFPGKPKHTSPSTIEFDHSNFVPQDKLVIYFYYIGSVIQPDSLHPRTRKAKKSDRQVTPAKLTKEDLDIITKSAHEGNVPDQDKLGNMYFGGRGVEKDYKQALYWYKMEAEAGVASAQRKVGIMYEIGYGVDRNSKEAEKWYKLSKLNSRHAEAH